MPRIEKKTKQIVTATSIVAALAIILLGYFLLGDTAELDNYFFIGLVILTAPLAVVNYLDYSWKKAIDARLPDLFKSIVQGQQVGMTLPQALEEAAKRDYGPLTAELKKMTVQMSWGYTFEEALLGFGKRVGTVLMQRLLPLIIEASRSGGSVEKVFGPMGKFIQTNNMLEKERKNQTRPYIIIIYVALFVFLFTIVLLFKTFFATVEGESLISTPSTTSADMQRIFLHMTLIQSFFGGLAAGKMGEGSTYAGLKHSLVMIVVSFMAIRMFM
jgi:flagellar protein FlaJ